VLTHYPHKSDADRFIARTIVNVIGTLFYLALIMGGVVALASAWARDVYWPAGMWVTLVVAFISGGLFVDQLHAAQQPDQQRGKTDGKET
jgi:hypothetical protein